MRASADGRGNRHQGGLAPWHRTPRHPHPAQPHLPLARRRSCNCAPTYEAWVYSKRDGKKIRRSFPTLAAAKGWRTDALKQVKDKRLRAPSARTLRAGGRRVARRRPRGRDPEQARAAVQARRRPQLRAGAPAARAARARRPASSPTIDLADLLELKERLAGRRAAPARRSATRSSRCRRSTGAPAATASSPINPTLDLALPTAGQPRPGRDAASRRPSSSSRSRTLERALWATAFYAGLRRGELRALRVGDVDLDAAHDRGRARLGRQGGRDRAEVAGGHPDACSSLDALRPHLEPLVDGRDAGRRSCSAAAPDSRSSRARRAEGRAGVDALERGEPTSRERAWTAALVAGSRCTRRGTRSRRGWTTPGCRETRADRYMGHSSGTVAGRYRHLLPGQLAEDRERLDAYLAGAAAGKVVPLAAAVAYGSPRRR